MGRALCLSVLVLAGYAAAANAQKPAEPKGAGMKCSAWETKTMAGPKDSVVTTSVLEATADGKGWSLQGANSPHAIPGRVITTGGDSMVTEAGAVPSVLWPGQKAEMPPGMQAMERHKITPSL